MERGNVSTSSSSVPMNVSRSSLWPVIGDADLLPDDLSISLKLTFVIAYTTIILMALYMILHSIKFTSNRPISMILQYFASQGNVRDDILIQACADHVSHCTQINWPSSSLTPPSSLWRSVETDWWWTSTRPMWDDYICLMGSKSQVWPVQNNDSLVFWLVDEQGLSMMDPNSWQVWTVSDMVHWCWNLMTNRGLSDGYKERFDAKSFANGTLLLQLCDEQGQAWRMPDEHRMI